MEQETSQVDVKKVKKQRVVMPKTRFKPPGQNEDKDPGATVWYMGF